MDNAEWNEVLISCMSFHLPSRDRSDISLAFYILAIPVTSLLIRYTSLVLNSASLCHNSDSGTFDLLNEITNKHRFVNYWAQKVEELYSVPVNVGSPDYKSTCNRSNGFFYQSRVLALYYNGLYFRVNGHNSDNIDSLGANNWQLNCSKRIRIVPNHQCET